ncbi:uncharacterized protein PSFLO_05000 [Pseudozyma flocculosa]|uniref:Uncharacterized protein n=1 Tax=Pseudozyma flocculosa TaxID=84751 RepID=A0A5C3F7Y3_9BASI|nr:uncharacterized protein PSFLO_05000 [Pseudozyma flocculosa]
MARPRSPGQGTARCYLAAYVTWAARTAVREAGLVQRMRYKASQAAGCHGAATRRTKARIAWVQVGMSSLRVLLACLLLVFDAAASPAAASPRTDRRRGGRRHLACPGSSPGNRGPLLLCWSRPGSKQAARGKTPLPSLPACLGQAKEGKRGFLRWWAPRPCLAVAARTQLPPDLLARYICTRCPTLQSWKGAGPAQPRETTQAEGQAKGRTVWAHRRRQLSAGPSVPRRSPSCYHYVAVERGPEYCSSGAAPTVLVEAAWQKARRARGGRGSSGDALEESRRACLALTSWPELAFFLPACAVVAPREGEAEKRGKGGKGGKGGRERGRGSEALCYRTWAPSPSSGMTLGVRLQATDSCLGLQPQSTRPLSEPPPLSDEGEGVSRDDDGVERGTRAAMRSHHRVAVALESDLLSSPSWSRYGSQARQARGRVGPSSQGSTVRLLASLACLRLLACSALAYLHVARPQRHPPPAAAPAAEVDASMSQVPCRCDAERAGRQAGRQARAGPDLATAWSLGLARPGLAWLRHSVR